MIAFPSSRKSILISQLLAVAFVFCLIVPGRAAEEPTGQEDLDRATLVKLSAKVKSLGLLPGWTPGGSL